MINNAWLMLYKASKEELTSLIEPAAGEENRELISWQSFWSYRTSQSYLLRAFLFGRITRVVCKSKSFIFMLVTGY